MAGIYVHVPFCKVKCHYCDFHFSVQLKNRDKMVEAICQELVLRKNYLAEEMVETIYFGGGTPSLLEQSAIVEILETIHKNYVVNSQAEITLECNPDDLNSTKLAEFVGAGVNRLSIGIQSFQDEVLRFMNRAHSAAEARNAVLMAQKSGIHNLTIDLMYGIPGTTMESWKGELAAMVELNVPHLSAYCLTIEENTVFGNWHKKGKINSYPDEESLEQFRYLMEFTAKHGYEQYEISNFSKPGFNSKHNSAYWKGKKYLGIGPSAHSYNLKERAWNVANNVKYMRALQNGEAFSEKETLSLTDRFNEYLLVRLRTKWGIRMADLNEISLDLAQKVEGSLADYVSQGKLKQEQDVFTLTTSGKFIADAISADLFQ